MGKQNIMAYFILVTDNLLETAIPLFTTRARAAHTIYNTTFQLTYFTRTIDCDRWRMTVQDIETWSFVAGGVC